MLAGAALLASPLAVFAPLGLAPLLAVAGVALLAAGGRDAIAAVRPYTSLAVLFLLVSAWAALSALWSPIPGHSLFEAVRFLAIAAAGLVVTASAASLAEDAALRCLRALLAGTTLAILLLQVERHAGEPIAHWLGGLAPAEPLSIARYDRGVTVLLLLSLPGASFLAQRRRWGLFALLAVAVPATIAEFASHTAILALAIAVLTGALAWRWPRVIAVALVAVMAFIATLFPLLAPGGGAIEHIGRTLPMLPGSAIHRLAIWRFAADRIADRPFLGWGMDSARAIPGGRLPVVEIFPQLHLTPLAQAMPLHPHDAALQWRLELGLPGLILLLALLAVALWRLAASRAAPRRTALAFAYAGAALTVALLSFGAWQAWWVSLLWLGVAFELAGARAARAADP